MIRLLFLAAASCAMAQDVRRVASPDGQWELRLYVTTQEDRNLSRLAYDVTLHGKVLVDQSYLGLDIWDQEPLLGENTGLISSHFSDTLRYRAMTARYMQNGSLGRLLEVEARAYDSGVAFRYVVPRSILLKDVRLAEEATEFAVKTPGTVTITELPRAGFPPLRLLPGSPIMARLGGGEAKIVLEAPTPLVFPWRVIAGNGEAEKLLDELRTQDAARPVPGAGYSTAK